MKVLIITEGGKGIGLGHIVRCSALWEAFDTRGASVELVVNGDETVNAVLEHTRHRRLNWLRDRDKVLVLAEGARVVVIDSYLAPRDLYSTVAALVDVCVYIDDTARLDYPGGLVVNGTVFAEEMDYPARDGITYLLGSRYIPLRKEFWHVSNRHTRPMVEHVMLTFGANDPANMTQRILKRLCNQYPRIRKTVVLGKGLANSRGVTEAKDSRTKLVRNASAKAMKNIMTESDVAITACGQTLYELARVGVPTIGIVVAENQLGNARGWEKSGFLEYAGWWTDNNIVEATLDSFERLAQARIRRHRADVGRSFVDGKGSVRVAECALEKSGRA